MRTYFIPCNSLSHRRNKIESMITHYKPNLDPEYWREIDSLTEEQILSLGYEKLKASIGFVKGCYIKRLVIIPERAPDDTIEPKGA